ncbi:hypothetical protein ACGLWX_13890 [Halomonas sp. HMF6819]|uniref:hypothetical protein n=1 Tax=Halomonas sp. HMF6819 TaxID=3373085 RepID=UPI00379DA3F0
MKRVALVAFDAGPYRYALEASRVERQRLEIDTERHMAAATLLGASGHHAPKRWLTLNDREGAWQLGVEGRVELIEWPAGTLHPLPPLVLARSTLPALCGVALDDHRVALWLLEADRLSPFAPPSPD